MKAKKAVTEEAFYRLCKAHDLLYMFTDDNRAYIAGRASLKAIKVAAEQLPRDVAVRIWNGIVDEKLADNREHHYWKGDEIANSN